MSFQKIALVCCLLLPAIAQGQMFCQNPDNDQWEWQFVESCDDVSKASVCDNGGGFSCLIDLLFPDNHSPVEPESEPESAGVCVDTSGDGWGWDGKASCRVDGGESETRGEAGTSGSAEASGSSATPASGGDCIDDNNDGWGWDGQASCRILASSSGTTTDRLPTVAIADVEGQCIDDNNDGWGWDGQASCRVESGGVSSAAATTETNIVCVDDNNDGWGWDGAASCRVSDVSVATASGGNASGGSVSGGNGNTGTLSLSALGELIFNDTNLSSPVGQSCASCHDSRSGFDDPDSGAPSSLGANGATFGPRNSSTLGYAALIPHRQTVSRRNLFTLAVENVPFGGLFADGRASTLEEQVKVPLFNPLEMGLSSRQQLVNRIQQSSYAQAFEARFGETVFEDGDRTLDSAASAIAAFERTSVFSPFNSKFDRVSAGSESFTAAEARGQSLFNGRANCATCHASPNGDELFSDFLYHNIGTPRNERLLNNIGDTGFIDRGLGAITGNSAHDGAFRTPTLRNIARTAPYMHNGVFNSLREVVEFYNNRVQTPEVARNLSLVFVVGNLGLTERDINDLVAFLNTMTDR